MTALPHLPLHSPLPLGTWHQLPAKVAGAGVSSPPTPPLNLAPIPLTTTRDWQHFFRPRPAVAFGKLPQVHRSAVFVDLDDLSTLGTRAAGQATFVGASLAALGAGLAFYFGTYVAWQNHRQTQQRIRSIDTELRKPDAQAVEAANQAGFAGSALQNAAARRQMLHRRRADDQGALLTSWMIGAASCGMGLNCLFGPALLGAWVPALVPIATAILWLSVPVAIAYALRCTLAAYRGRHDALRGLTHIAAAQQASHGDADRITFWMDALRGCATHHQHSAAQMAMEGVAALGLAVGIGLTASLGMIGACILLPAVIAQIYLPLRRSRMVQAAEPLTLQQHVCLGSSQSIAQEAAYLQQLSDHVGFMMKCASPDAVMPALLAAYRALRQKALAIHSRVQSPHGETTRTQVREAVEAQQTRVADLVMPVIAGQTSQDAQRSAGTLVLTELGLFANLVESLSRRVPKGLLLCGSDTQFTADMMRSLLLRAQKDATLARYIDHSLHSVCRYELPQALAGRARAHWELLMEVLPTAAGELNLPAT